MIREERYLHAALGKGRTILVRAALAMVVIGATLQLSAQPTKAATVATFTVTTLDYAGDDANPGDGLCATAAAKCTLRAAVQEANALNVGAGDNVLIRFDDGLAGFIVGPDGNNTANRMKTGIIARGLDHDGAYYHLTGRMTIDFGNEVGFTQYHDQGTAFFIDGPGITIRNFNAEATNPPGTIGARTVKGITGGETAFVVSDLGDGATFANGKIAELGNNRMERAIVLLSGADDVTIRNVTFDEFKDLGGALRILDESTVPGVAEISGLTLDGVQMLNSTVPASYYYGLFADNGTIFNDLTIVNSTFDNWRGQRTLWMRGTTVNGAQIEGNTFTGQDGIQTLWPLDFEGAKLTDVSLTGNLFDRLDANRMVNLAGTTMNDVRIADNTIQNITEPSTNVFDVRSATATDLSFTGNTFNNVRIDGGWRVLDLTGSSFTNLLIDDNDFVNLTATGAVIDLRSSTTTGVSITNNRFQDSSVANWPAIWTDRVSPNSVVQNNSFVNPDNTKKYAWVFVFDHDGIAAATNTGWRVLDNHIQVAPAASEAPIRIDSGILPVERNTFSAPARGTTVADDLAAKSETDASWFVWNLRSSANGKLRTWYPTAAVVDSVTERASITVQPPTGVAPEIPVPSTPVSIDVYYTPGSGGERQADQYLGRLVGVTTAGTYELACVGCASTGFLRVQTIAPNGATTQYSRIVQPTDGTVGSVAVSIDLAPGDEVPVGSTVTGTGNAGTTVQVVNTDTSEELCETTVDGAGTWSCVIDPGAAQGPASVAVQEVGPVTITSDPVSVIITPAIVGVSMFGPGGFLLLGAGGLLLLVRRRRSATA